MPVFRINISFASGKSFKEYHRIDGVELDTYYKRLLWLARRAQVPIVSFDVVQVSDLTREAILMREHNLKRLSRYVPNMQPRPRMGKRKRRL